MGMLAGQLGGQAIGAASEITQALIQMGAMIYKNENSGGDGRTKADLNAGTDIHGFKIDKQEANDRDKLESEMAHGFATRDSRRGISFLG